MNDPGNMLMDKSLRSVFVGNIPYEATEEKLKDIFNQAGSVGWCPFTSAFLSTSYFLRASSFPHSVSSRGVYSPHPQPPSSWSTTGRRGSRRVTASASTRTRRLRFPP